jgi:hypothetical protein
MRWSPRGAHLLLQVRTRVLNNTLTNDYRRWCPGFTHTPEADTLNDQLLAAELPRNVPLSSSRGLGLARRSTAISRRKTSSSTRCRGPADQP